MFSREILRVKARTEPIPRRRAWRLASLRFTNCLKRREMLQSRHFLQPARNIPPTGQWAECPPYKCWHDGPGPGLERTGGAGGSWSGCGWSRETILSYWVVNQDSPTREGEIAGVTGVSCRSLASHSWRVAEIWFGWRNTETQHHHSSSWYLDTDLKSTNLQHSDW